MQLRSKCNCMANAVAGSKATERGCGERNADTEPRVVTTAAATCSRGQELAKTAIRLPKAPSSGSADGEQSVVYFCNSLTKRMRRQAVAKRER